MGGDSPLGETLTDFLDAGFDIQENHGAREILCV